ncbi:hypothetical protein PZA11_006374 [Diplocarpon coronariae]|nr:hypothetical protein JHW43_002046 [Diplocarpon mali]
MQYSTLINIFVAATFFVAGGNAWCEQAHRNEDCCYSSERAKDRQDELRWNGQVRLSSGTICNAKVQSTCGADCCSQSTGWGIGCPNLTSHGRQLLKKTALMTQLSDLESWALFWG